MPEASSQPQSFAERYSQWWVEQRERYCPSSYIESDREARLQRLAAVEQEMANAVSSHAELDQQIERWNGVSDAARPRQSMTRWAESRLQDHQRMALDWLKVMEDRDRLDAQYPPEQATAFRHFVFNDPSLLPLGTRIMNRLRSVFH